MKFIYHFTIFVFISIAFTGCEPISPPVLNDINPKSVVPRQIVAVNGSNLDISFVEWDAGSTPRKVANSTLLSARYFQIPENATTNTSHPVRLFNYSGNSTNTININVVPLSGVWPAPRIEEITYRLIDMNTTTNTMTLVLYISVANVDVNAEVKIGGTVRGSSLYSAIPSDYFATHKPQTYRYPIYHYGQLIAAIASTPGNSFDVQVKNIDGKTAQTTFTLPSNVDSLDSDNDGLLDKWEIYGYTGPVNGHFIDLKAMGCDPYKKDILVEADWMVDAVPPDLPDFSLAVIKPHDAIWDEIAKVYKNAPVLNPDGSQGINIHIDRGQDIGIPGGVFTGGGSQVEYHPSIDFEASHPSIPKYACFYDLKANFFDPDRLNIFHYCIFAYRSPGGDAGRGEIWGNDFMITLADLYNKRDKDISQVGSFIHELGHNIGLRHGGIDNAAPDEDTINKPNLPSTMNYRYSLDGIPLKCDYNSSMIHSYSQGMLKPIFETAVDENIGICDDYGFDMDGNGTTSGGNRPKDVDLNGTKTDILNDYDQWGNLKLNFLANGSGWNNN